MTEIKTFVPGDTLLFPEITAVHTDFTVESRSHRIPLRCRDGTLWVSESEMSSISPVYRSALENSESTDLETDETSYIVELALNASLRRMGIAAVPLRDLDRALGFCHKYGITAPYWDIFLTINTAILVEAGSIKSPLTIWLWGIAKKYRDGVHIAVQIYCAQKLAVSNENRNVANLIIDAVVNRGLNPNRQTLVNAIKYADMNTHRARAVFTKNLQIIDQPSVVKKLFCAIIEMKQDDLSRVSVAAHAVRFPEAKTDETYSEILRRKMADALDAASIIYVRSNDSPPESISEVELYIMDVAASVLDKTEYMARRLKGLQA